MELFLVHIILGAHVSAFHLCTLFCGVAYSDISDVVLRKYRYVLPKYEEKNIHIPSLSLFWPRDGG